MRPGVVIGGRFTIERLAGAGGMGSVYRAHDAAHGVPVALKILHSEGAAEQARFAREARVLAGLNHPGVVRYIAHGIAPGGELYLAMEWLEGEDLSARIKREILSVEESLLLIRCAAEGLAVAHAKGVVHRDVKPSNLFLPDCELARVKVLDFGIARAQSPSFAVTGTGKVLGTPAYMAPEQACGERDLDVRVDVFALGCVLFECLIGRPLFAGSQPLAVLAKILLQEAPRARELRGDVSKEVDVLLARMLSKDPAVRPRDGAELADIIGELRPQRNPSAPSLTAGLTAGEQRLVCVILAAVDVGVESSLSGLSPATPTLTPDQRDVPLEALRAAAARFEARVIELAGGSVMATLSGQGSATDLAVRAARCALSMREVWLDASLVLATGRGMIQGRLAVGEAIDRAVTLLQTGPRSAGGIHLDKVTAGLLDARFEVRSSGDGDAELLGERDALADPARMLLGKPTPFVGRDRELATLEATLAECVAEGVARVALMTGSAGAGKSRVRRELLRALRRRDDRVVTWFAAGDAMHAGSPFGLLAQLLRRAAGAKVAEPLAIRRDKLRALVARRIEGAGDARVAEFLGEIMGAPFLDDGRIELRAARADPVLMGDQMRRAWDEFLSAACAAQPILIVIEDLHWGDSPSVQFLDAALRSQRSRPLMVLALGRPDVHERFPRLWVDRNVQEIRLGELSRRASERLVRQVLGEGVKADVVERVVTQAGGNAFYLEELIRAEAEGKGAAPGTVLAMVQARLLSLPAAARRMIRAASVFGEVFWEEGVAALLGDAEAAPEVGRFMATVVERELVVRHAESRFPGRREYAFRHALVRDGAYAMLTEEDQALGHRLAGAWLEHAGEADPVTLARHFERGGEGTRAAALYAQAMKQALDASDLDAVLLRAERAVACGATGHLLGAIRAMQAEAYQWRGDLALGERCCAEATALLPRDSPLWYNAATEQAMLARQLGDYQPLTRLAEELCREEATEQALDAALMAMASVGWNLLLLGMRRTAVPLFERMVAARSLAEAHPLFAGHLHAAFAARAYDQEDLLECVAALEASAASFVRAGHLRYVAIRRREAPYIYLELGATGEAEASLHESIELSRRFGLMSVELSAKYVLGIALARRGALDEAFALWSSLLEAVVRVRDRTLECWTRSRLARLLLWRGDLEGAGREAKRAMEASPSAPNSRCLSLNIAVEVDLARGLAREARARAAAAMRLFEQGGGIIECQGIMRINHAEALRAVGDREGAESAIERARGWLMARAVKMGEPEVRRRFLEDVPEHARIMRLAAEWVAPQAEPSSRQSTK